MRVTVNGRERELQSGATVVSVLALLDLAPEARGVAVALDGEVISRARWPQAELRDGALVEVVSAIQGG